MPPQAATNENVGVIRRFVRQPLAVIAACYLLIVIVAVVLAPVLAPYAADKQDLRNALSGPSSDHLLGAGELGRDVLSRLLFGGRRTLTSVLVAVATFGAIGITTGIAAGYLGGRFDRVVLRVTDVIYAMPAAIMLLVVIAVFPQQQAITMIALGVLSAPSMARVVRSVTRGVGTELFVSAARAGGLGRINIMRRHVLPLLAGPIIVQLTLFAAAAIGLETALGFLGLGPSGPSWGALVAEASKYLGVQPWLLVPSGVNIIVFVIAIGLVGDGLRDSVTDALHGVALAPRRTARSATGHTADAAPPTAGDVTPAAGDVTRSDGFHPPSATSRSIAGVAVAATVESGPAATPLLRVTGLVTGFDSPAGTTVIVRGVDFAVRRGTALGIVGESGCGKSITMASITGLLPDGGRVLGGTIEFDGRPITPDGPEQTALRGSRIGWISQHPVAGLDPSFTIGSQLAQVVRRHHGSARRTATASALELLAAVQLDDPQRVASSYPHQLSGGMAQRVAIALALAGEPDLLIADEPTTALDVTVQAEILDLLHDLVDAGTALVIVTHSWGVLADLCDEALVMYSGEIVERGSVAELSVRPRHPYTAALLRATPYGVPAGGHLDTIPGQPTPAGATIDGCRFADRCAHTADVCRGIAVPLLAIAPDHAARCLRSSEMATELARQPVGVEPS